MFSKKSIDLYEAANIMKNTLNILSECRENVLTRLTEIYKSSESMAETQKVYLKILRNRSRQTNHINYPTNNTEEYYKLAIFITLLDVNHDLNAHFSQKNTRVLHAVFHIIYFLTSLKMKIQLHIH